MTDILAVAVVVLLTAVIYLYYIDIKLFKDIKGSHFRLRSEQLKIISEHKSHEISVSDVRSQIRKFKEEIDMAQEHLAKMRDQQRIILKRQRWLKDNCTRKIDLQVSDKDKLFKTLKEQIKGLA